MGGLLLFTCNSVGGDGLVFTFNSVGGLVSHGSRMTAALQHPGYDLERLRCVAEKMPCRVTHAGTLLSLMGEVSASRSM